MRCETIYVFISLIYACKIRIFSGIALRNRPHVNLTHHIQPVLIESFELSQR